MCYGAPVIPTSAAERGGSWSDPQTFAHRVLVVNGLAMGSVVLFGFADPWLTPTLLRPLWTLKALVLLAGGAAILALRRAPRESDIRLIALWVIATGTFGSALSGVLTGDAVTTQMMCMTGLVISSLLLPWGPYWQAAAASIAAAALFTNVAFVGQGGYPLVAAISLLLASIFIADRLRVRELAMAEAYAATHASERFLRKMTDQLPAIIAYVDTEGRFRFVNRLLATWAGYTPEAMIGSRLVDVTDPAYVAVLEPHIAAALAGERRTFELEVRDPNGEVRCLAHVVEPDIESDGSVRGFFSLARDVTDTKRAEEAVRRHQAELAHVQRLTTMGEMVAALGHELNQPLQAIAAYAVSCYDSVPADLPQANAVRALATLVSDEALRAGEIIRRLQRLARRAEPKVEAVDANAIARNALRLVRAEAEHLHIQLAVELAEDLPPVRADSIQIEQVLVNLLLNAIQAVDRCEDVQRRILTRTALAPGGGVCFSVEDSGPGISPQHRDKIFEPYFTTKAEGLGMGLAISRSILAAHEGTLTLDPAPASVGGAHFSLWLPAASPVQP